MKQEGLMFFTDLHIPIIALCLFLAVFFGAITWVFRNGSKELYNKQSKLVFWDGDRNER